MIWKYVVLFILITLLLFKIFNSKRDDATPERKSGITQESASTSARIPEGWQSYQNNSWGLSMHYPPAFEIQQNGENSILVVKKVPVSTQEATNFIYISAIEEGASYDDGEIYNYNKAQLHTLTRMDINDEKPLAGDSAGIKEHTIYKRLPDTVISGKTAQFFVNMKPWGFPMGTHEYRNIVVLDDRTFLIGGYISTVGHNEYSISKELFEGITRTILLNDN